MRKGENRTGGRTAERFGRKRSGGAFSPTRACRERQRAGDSRPGHHVVASFISLAAIFFANRRCAHPAALPLANIVALLAWSASQSSVFAHSLAFASSATGRAWLVPPSPQKVTLSFPARLQARSRRETVAINLLRFKGGPLFIRREGRELNSKRICFSCRVREKHQIIEMCRFFVLFSIFLLLAIAIFVKSVYNYNCQAITKKEILP